MYTTINFKTKKALKEAVAKGEKVEVYQPNDMFGVTDEVLMSPKRTISIEGPHYPEAHTWYASAEVEFGVVKKVS